MVFGAFWFQASNWHAFVKFFICFFWYQIACHMQDDIGLDFNIAVREMQRLPSWKSSTWKKLLEDGLEGMINLLIFRLVLRSLKVSFYLPNSFG